MSTQTNEFKMFLKLLIKFWQVSDYCQGPNTGKNWNVKYSTWQCCTQNQWRETKLTRQEAGRKVRQGEGGEHHLDQTKYWHKPWSTFSWVDFLLPQYPFENVTKVTWSTDNVGKKISCCSIINIHDMNKYEPNKMCGWIIGNEIYTVPLCLSYTHALMEWISQCRSRMRVVYLGCFRPLCSPWQCHPLWGWWCPNQSFSSGHLSY